MPSLFLQQLYRGTLTVALRRPFPPHQQQILAFDAYVKLSFRNPITWSTLSKSACILKSKVYCRSFTLDKSPKRDYY